MEPSDEQGPLAAKRPARGPHRQKVQGAATQGMQGKYCPPLRFPHWVQAAGRAAGVDYSLFTITKASIYSSLLPYQLESVRDFFRSVLPPLPGLKIIDATAHIGCDTCNFAWLYPGADITAVEVDPLVYGALLSNVVRLGRILARDVPPVRAVNADCLEYLKGLAAPVDLVYFDPPWGAGWHETRGLEIASLDIGGRSLAEVVGETRSASASTVVVKIPCNLVVDSFVAGIKAVFPMASLEVKDILKPKKGIAYRLVAVQ